MNNIKIEATKSTPEISSNYNDKIIRIEGKSYPEDAFTFYKPVIKWITEFLKKNNDKIILKFNLIYTNTGSSKSILSIINLLEEAYLEGIQASIFWHYNTENDMAFDAGEDLKEGLKIPFNLVEEIE